MEGLNKEQQYFNCPKKKKKNKRNHIILLYKMDE